MPYVDPTTVRLSDTLLLSDAISCDSIYRYGYANKFSLPEDRHKLAEGKKLANLLDRLHEEHGPYSVAYGYISPELSKKIVRYQDPKKPSYHRWDYGAAMDVCFHEWEEAPILLAHEIDTHHDYSRMITYAESQWICIGTRISEIEGVARKAFYENRYVGTPQPHRITYSQNPVTRATTKEGINLEYDWRGRGWPSYHGGGKFQLQHHRISRYSVMSDYFYHSRNVHNGKFNYPPVSEPKKEKFLDKLRYLGEVIDTATESFKTRFSIVKTHVSAKTNCSGFVEMVPNLGVAPDDVAHFLSEKYDSGIEVIAVKTGEDRVKIYV